MENKIFKTLIILFVIIFLTPFANAVVLTHPDYDSMTVDEDGIFFSGKISRYEKVYIDGVPIIPAKTGAFSYSVPLKIGENIFAVQSKDWLGNKTTKRYVITRISKEKNKDADTFIESEKSYYKTTRDNVVLRSTPIDKGMNRMGYLSKDTKVFVDGKFNEFSRIYLSEDYYGWIMTKDLEKTEKTEYLPTKLVSTDQVKTEKDTTYIFTCIDNPIYSAIVDDNKLILTIYNLDDQDEKYIKEFKFDKFPRYSISVQNGILYLTFKKNPINSANYSNKNVKIVIDPGHGGKEPGAIGCLGHKEKDLNLEVALKLKKILEEHQYNVKLTRETDKYMSLNDRIKFAQDNDALIFISIHQNSVQISKNPLLNEGTVVFYFNPQSMELAQTLSKSVSQSLLVKNQGATQASFAVIRPTEYIGVLAELIYLVNPNDVSVYKQKKFAHTSALAIYNGLSAYLHAEMKK